MLWHIPRDATLKAAPAIQDALCICARAFRSDPSVTHRSRKSKTVRMDFSAKASVKSLAFVETNASIACVRTSIPVSAVIFGGTVSVSSGSRNTTSGVRSSSTSGYLTPAALSVMTANAVTSLPVPLVVGSATSRGSSTPQY